MYSNNFILNFVATPVSHTHSLIFLTSPAGGYSDQPASKQQTIKI
jgi:hypothetical protein